MTGVPAASSMTGRFGPSAPEAFGGAETDYVSYALALIEIGAADGALSTIISIQNSLIVSGLLRAGTEDQKARFLPDLIAGRTVGAFALTEADAGSDAAAIRTRATSSASSTAATATLPRILLVVPLIASVKARSCR